MHIFYSESINNNTTIVLDETESHHATRVLRLSQYDRVKVFDGKGNVFICIISDMSSKKRIELKIDSTINHKPKQSQIHIAVAPTKNIDRFEWFLEKSTELGVDMVSPILCERSERKVVKQERFEKIIVAAMKQSGNPFKPICNQLSEYEEFINSDITGDKYIAYCEDLPRDHLFTHLQKSSAMKCTVLIGPEGDFSSAEYESALARGFVPVSLGDLRLRTETAALYAVQCASLPKNL